MFSKGVGEPCDKSSSTLENDLTQVLASIHPGSTTVLPISINQRHFAGLVVKSDQGGNKTVYYTDPAGRVTRGSEGYPDVEAAISAVIVHDKTPKPLVIINISQGAGDGNCGPVLIARLQMISQASEPINVSVMQQQFSNIKPEEVRAEQAYAFRRTASEGRRPTNVSLSDERSRIVLTASARDGYVRQEEVRANEKAPKTISRHYGR